MGLGLVLGRRDGRGHGPWAHGVAADGRGHGQGLVRAAGVVDLAPGVKGALGLSQIGQPVGGQHLGLEGAVEALVLALGLRMIGSSVDHADAQIEQPDGQRRMPLTAAAGSPGEPLSVRMRKGRP